MADEEQKPVMGVDEDTPAVFEDGKEEAADKPAEKKKRGKSK